MGNICGGTSDSRLLMTAVAVRMFSFGWIAVVLFLYLISLGEMLLSPPPSSSSCSLSLLIN